MGSELDPTQDPSAISTPFSIDAQSSSTSSHTQARDNRPRKKTSTACSVCKKRKTRCSGESPCDRCIQRGTVAECVIDTNADLRRRGATEKRTEELENDKRLLDGLLETIRTGSEEQVQALFRLIRRDISRSDLLSHIDGLLQGSGGSVASESSVFEGSQPSSPQDDGRRGSQNAPTPHRVRPSIHDLLNHEPVFDEAAVWSTRTEILRRVLSRIIHAGASRVKARYHC